MIERSIANQVLDDLKFFPVVAIVGPRQVGKTTFAKWLQSRIEKPSLYLDLELSSDLDRLESPEIFLRLHQDKCVIIDEIQRLPSLFPLLRALIDQKREPARFVLLGSASPELVRESSETLAGRIVYVEMMPFSLPEISSLISMEEHWLRGGFPEALLAPYLNVSQRWLDNFLTTVLERDLRQLGYDISLQTLNKMLSVVGTIHGNLLNMNALAIAVGVSSPTVKRYLDLLEGSFLLHSLQPYFANIGKRLVKTPKLYVRDSGVFHRLFRISSMEDLASHIMLGASWEGYVVEQIRRVCGNDWQYFFYRTQAGAEADLVLISPKGVMVCVEIKYSLAPSIPRGFHQSLTDLKPQHAWVVIPQGEPYPKKDSVWVAGLPAFLDWIGNI